MKNSIYLKTIIFFIAILFLSNLLMIIVFVNSFSNSMNVTNEEYVNDYAVAVRSLYDHGVNKEQILKTANSDRISVVLYGELKDIPEKIYDIISVSDYDLIEQGDIVYVRSTYTAAIIKLDTEYCVVTPARRSRPVPVNMAILFSALITFSVATFIVFIGIGTFIKPLINMSVAARRVAGGDYNVRLQPMEHKDTVSQLVDDFNEMCYKLSQTEMLRNDFISGISHEFKTPLQSIYGFANLLLEETNNSTHREYLTSICEEAERLSTLSSSILQLNRLDNMTDLGDMEYYQMDELIRETLLMLEGKWAAKQIDLDIQLDKLKISGREDLMKQVFINLIDNAIKFTPDKGHIDIKLIKNDKDAVFTISDSGRGITDGDKPLVFEKFYKGDHSRHSVGNGLGLSIVKLIIRLHGYNISVLDSYYGGAKFLITMPLDNSS